MYSYYFVWLSTECKRKIYEKLKNCEKPKFTRKLKIRCEKCKKLCSFEFLLCLCSSMNKYTPSNRSGVSRKTASSVSFSSLRRDFQRHIFAIKIDFFLKIWIHFNDLIICYTIFYLMAFPCGTLEKCILCGFYDFERFVCFIVINVKVIK